MIIVALLVLWLGHGQKMDALDLTGLLALGFAAGDGPAVQLGFAWQLAGKAGLR
jgi:hypothetical protein